jgi:hypothetical protein
MIPNVAGEIKTVAEFNSMVRAMAEITSLTVSAYGGPGAGGPGGGSKMGGDLADIPSVYADAITKFKNKWGSRTIRRLPRTGGSEYAESNRNCGCQTKAGSGCNQNSNPLIRFARPRAATGKWCICTYPHAVGRSV